MRWRGKFTNYYPDRISESCGTRVGYSPIEVKKEDSYHHKKEVEYHTTTPELILPLNDDMIIHVGATGGHPVTNLRKRLLFHEYTGED